MTEKESVLLIDDGIELDNSSKTHSCYGSSMNMHMLAVLGTLFRTREQWELLFSQIPGRLEVTGSWPVDGGRVIFEVRKMTWRVRCRDSLCHCTRALSCSGPHGVSITIWQWDIRSNSKSKRLHPFYRLRHAFKFNLKPISKDFAHFVVSITGKKKYLLRMTDSRRDAIRCRITCKDNSPKTEMNDHFAKLFNWMFSSVAKMRNEKIQ